MPYTRLDSSHVNGAEYDEASGALHVRFNDGSEWTYHDVPAEVAAGLMAADSAGRYLRQSIKPLYSATRR